IQLPCAAIAVVPRPAARNQHARAFLSRRHCSHQSLRDRHPAVAQRGPPLRAPTRPQNAFARQVHHRLAGAEAGGQGAVIALNRDHFAFRTQRRARSRRRARPGANLPSLGPQPHRQRAPNQPRRAGDQYPHAASLPPPQNLLACLEYKIYSSRQELSMRIRPLALPLLLVAAFALAAAAQGTAADYARANNLRQKFRGLATGVPGPANWIEGTDHFWYHISVTGGTEFIWVDTATKTKRPAFDHARLASALSSASGTSYTAITLPFFDPPAANGRGGTGAGGLRLINGERAITFGLSGHFWTCDLTAYTCTQGAALPAGGRGRGGRGPAMPAVDDPPYDPAFDAPPMLDNDVIDGLETLVPEQARPPQVAAAVRPGPTSRLSPDGQWEAIIENFNVFLRHPGDKTATPLSFDGSEGNYYSLRSLAWSPNSKYLAAFSTRPGYDRHIQYVESSPETQVQPISFQGPLYQKPGDTVAIAHPALFDVATRKEVEIKNDLFPNPYDLTPPVWWQDSRGFTFEYNQRGHQVYR